MARSRRGMFSGTVRRRGMGLTEEDAAAGEASEVTTGETQTLGAGGKEPEPQPTQQASEQPAS